MDAVAHTQLIEQGRPVSESLYELEAELIDQLVGQWYVELPRQRGSIEDLLVSTRLTDLNGEARRLLQASSAVRSSAPWRRQPARSSRSRTMATPMSAGATTAIAPTEPTTIRSSLTRDRASSAIHPMIEG